ncbi:golgin subfamily A member 7B isoform X2 [Oxyura jamaicensis]|uniref:golgin subfamily A member 7B isoform X2 n=1 Tax=Oxyura jamaicensis TaxID=8884 RepID=UPI0015A6DEB5|nr:golgin subfamily A member 7B isoform X2 [Oxyura jamaicensis]
MGASPSAVGTPGTAGHGDTVHSLQELRRSASLATKVFVQRDYSDGTTCQFQTKFPPELESRIERQLFEETVKTLNSFYAEAEKIGGSSYLEGCLACATAYFIFLCMETHYEKVLKKISKYIQEQNEKIYAPRGLLLTDPLERGMRVIEISIYEDRCSSGSSSSGSSSSSSGGGGGRRWGPVTGRESLQGLVLPGQRPLRNPQAALPEHPLLSPERAGRGGPGAAPPPPATGPPQRLCPCSDPLRAGAAAGASQVLPTEPNQCQRAPAAPTPGCSAPPPLPRATPAGSTPVPAVPRMGGLSPVPPGSLLLVPRARRPSATLSACRCCAYPTRCPLLLPGIPTAPAAPCSLPDPVPPPLLLLPSPPLPHTSRMRPSPPCLGVPCSLQAPALQSPPSAPSSQPVGTPGCKAGPGGGLLEWDEPTRGCRVELSRHGSPGAAWGGLCPPGPPSARSLCA